MKGERPRKSAPPHPWWGGRIASRRFFTNARPRNTDNRSLAPFWIVKLDNATDVLITTKFTKDAIANVPKATLEIAAYRLELLARKRWGKPIHNRWRAYPETAKLIALVVC
ncbi:hypothetical protein ES708_24221 [subsurface metagenome]